MQVLFNAIRSVAAPGGYFRTAISVTLVPGEANQTISVLHPLPSGMEDMRWKFSPLGTEMLVSGGRLGVDNRGSVNAVVQTGPTPAGFTIQTSISVPKWSNLNVNVPMSASVGGVSRSTSGVVLDDPFLRGPWHYDLDGFAVARELVALEGDDGELVADALARGQRLAWLYRALGGGEGLFEIEVVE